MKLKEITSKIGSGATPRGGNNVYASQGISLIRSQNVLDYRLSKNGLAFINNEQAKRLENVTVKKNDVLLNITGDSIARVCVVPEDVLPARVNQHVSIIRCKDSDSSDYLSYYLQFLKPYLLKICRVGGTRNALTKDAIEKLEIFFPSNHKKIAAVLSALDAKIELNNRINTELEAMAKTLYDYWFVQFDFTISKEQANAMGKPELTGKPYKSSGGKMVYNDTLKRDIPEGWEVKTIAEWINCDKAGDWGQESEQGNYTEKVFCIRGADINSLNGNGVSNLPIRYILKKNKYKILVKYDLIVEISGGSPTQSTGRLSFIIEQMLQRFDNPLICSNFCKAISLKNNSYFFSFIYLWNHLYENDVLFGWEGKTSGIKNLLFDSFVNNYKVVFPPKQLADNFSKIAIPIHAKKQRNLKENKQLSQLRDWLLPMLMNGQVTVK